MKYATAFIFALAMLVSAGCGGGNYTAPPKANARPSTNTTAPKANTVDAAPEPTGPSMQNEYTEAAKAAFAAREAFSKNRTAENFGMWGAHLYDALRFEILQGRHNRSARGFYRLKALKEMKTDFLKTLGPKGWEDVSAYKAAKQSYNEVQQGE